MTLIKKKKKKKKKKKINLFVNLVLNGETT